MYFIGQWGRIMPSRYVKSLNYYSVMPRNLLHGKYIFLKRIGKGTSGDVFLVQYENKQHALKVIPVQSFNEKEVHFLRSLKHPNLVSLIHIDATARLKLIVMEYCNAGNIKTYQEKLPSGVYQLQEAIPAFYQVLKAVEYIHKSGYMHRDIKPENILVDSSTGKNIYKVADFGVCTGNTIAVSQNIGTPYFSAPEMLKDCSGYDCKIDVWALGATLFYMLTGKYPFGGDKRGLLADIESKCRSFHYEKYANNGTPELDDLFEKVFTLDPQKRLSVEEILSHPLFDGLQFKDYKSSTILKTSASTNKIDLRQFSIGNPSEENPISLPQLTLPTKRPYKTLQPPSGQPSYYSQWCNKNNILLLMIQDLIKAQKHFNLIHHRALIYNALKLYLIYHRNLLLQLQNKQAEGDLKKIIKEEAEYAHTMFIKQTELCEEVRTEIQKQFSIKSLKTVISIDITEKGLFGQFKDFYRLSTSLCYQNIRVSQNQQEILNQLKWRVFICHAFNRLFEGDKLVFEEYYRWIAPQRVIDAHKFHSWLSKDSPQNIAKAIKRLKSLCFEEPKMP